MLLLQLFVYVLVGLEMVLFAFLSASISRPNLLSFRRPKVTTTTEAPTTTTTEGPITSCEVTACGICSEMTSIGGTVSSRSFPGQYSNNEDCVFKITVKPGRQVLLAFRLFDVENGFDIVQVFNGPSITSTRLASLTGRLATPPGPITSSSNTMTIRFTTDGSVLGRWQAVYKVVNSGIDNK